MAINETAELAGTATDARPAYSHTAYMHPGALHAALDQCLVAVLRDYTRPVLTGVHVTSKGGRLTFAAADGFQLVAVTIGTIGEIAGGDFEAIIPAHVCKAALPALKAAAKLPDTLARLELPAGGVGEVAIATPAGTFRGDVIQGTYPNYETLIPAGDKGQGDRLAVNPAMMGAILKAADKHGKTREKAAIVRQRWEPPSAPIRLDWEREAGDPCGFVARAVVMPMFVSW